MDPAPNEDEAAMLRPSAHTPELEEPALRMQVGRLLGSAGAFRTSTAISEADIPSGCARSKGPHSATACKAPSMRRSNASAGWNISATNGGGREIIVSLLAPLVAGDHIYRRARLHQGISESLFGELREDGGRTAFFQDAYPDVSQRLSAPKVESGEAYAVLVRPGISIASIELLTD